MFDRDPATGVRRRMDGAGDPWAAEHRAELGPAHWMQDLDASIGIVAWASNSGERLFMEYVPDGWETRHEVIRRYATVALFDRKSTREAALHDRNRLSLGWYLDMCRRLSETQLLAPRFFFVCGGRAPWRMIEVDIWTGETGQEADLLPGQWSAVWAAFGLAELRRDLAAWLRSAGR